MVSLEIIKDYIYISRALDIPMPKGLKSISKMVGAITRVFNVIDTANIVIDTKKQNYAIEHIVYYHLGDVIRSSKREGVEIKYIYAYFEVKKLIDERKITYSYDDGLYWVNGWNIEKEHLKEKIRELDIKYLLIILFLYGSKYQNLFLALTTIYSTEEYHLRW